MILLYLDVWVSYKSRKLVSNFFYQIAIEFPFYRKLRLIYYYKRLFVLDIKLIENMKLGSGFVCLNWDLVLRFRLCSCYVVDEIVYLF